MLLSAARVLARVETLEVEHGRPWVTAADVAHWLETPARHVEGLLDELARRREVVRVLPPTGPARYRRRCSPERRGWAA